MSRIKNLNHFIAILKTKLGETKKDENNAYYLRDNGKRASYFVGKREAYEYVIKNLEKLVEDEENGKIS